MDYKDVFFIHSQKIRDALPFGKMMGAPQMTVQMLEKKRCTKLVVD